METRRCDKFTFMLFLHHFVLFWLSFCHCWVVIFWCLDYWLVLWDSILRPQREIGDSSPPGWAQVCGVEARLMMYRTGLSRTLFWGFLAFWIWIWYGETLRKCANSGRRTFQININSVGWHADFWHTLLSWWTSLDWISFHFWIPELFSMTTLRSAPCIISVVTNFSVYANLAVMTVQVAWVCWNWWLMAILDQLWNIADLVGFLGNGCLLLWMLTITSTPANSWDSDRVSTCVCVW